MSMTKYEIFCYNQEISEWQKAISFHAYCNRMKINEFFKENQKYLENLKKEIQELQKLYFVLDPDGTQKVNAEGQFMYLEGLTEEMYLTEWKALMSQKRNERYKPKISEQPKIISLNEAPAETPELILPNKE